MMGSYIDKKTREAMANEPSMQEVADTALKKADALMHDLQEINLDVYIDKKGAEQHSKAKVSVRQSMMRDDNGKYTIPEIHKDGSPAYVYEIGIMHGNETVALTGKDTNDCNYIGVRKWDNEAPNKKGTTGNMTYFREADISGADLKPTTKAVAAYARESGFVKETVWKQRKQEHSSPEAPKATQPQKSSPAPKELSMQERAENVNDFLRAKTPKMIVQGRLVSDGTAEYRNDEHHGERILMVSRSCNAAVTVRDTEQGASVEIGVRNKDGNIERFSGNTNWDIDKYIADSTFATAIKNVKAEIDKSHGLTPEHGSTRPKSNIER